MKGEIQNAAPEASILTAREIEYLSLVAMGFKNIEIADILSVTNSTVKKTLENIFSKLNAKNRTYAVTTAFVHRVITSQKLSEIFLRYKNSIEKISLVTVNSWFDEK